MPKTGANAESVASEIEALIIAAAQTSVEITDDDLDELIIGCLPEPSLADVQLDPPVATAIESISVRGIRSFGPEQTLRLSEGLTIVYAGNGQGKTSLTDALELLTVGSTTRRISLPNATAEVKDKDHITHLKPNGDIDPSSSPRVRVGYRRRQELRTCEWSSFGSPATNHPDIQVLPRRLLRELVNAKRTERAEPLGAALGLAETIALWTAVAKELKLLSSVATENDEAHILLLKNEVPTPDDDSEMLDALQRWENKQSPHPIMLTDPPAASPWSALARLISDNDQLIEQPASLSHEQQSLLSSFLAVVKPGSDCPACAQATVPDHRIEEVKRLLAESCDSDVRRERIAAVKKTCAELSNLATAWLQLTATEQSTAELPVAWTSASDLLRQTLESRESVPSVQWADSMASALSSLNDTRAQLISNYQTCSLEARDRAIAAVRSDVSRVLQSLRNQEFREAVLTPLLARASLRV